MIATASTTPPQPLPEPEAVGFWEATARGELAMCRCQECRSWLMPPLERCRHCAAATAFEPVRGSGTIYTFIVQRQPAIVGYLDEVPYVVALVELDEQAGMRLAGRVVGVAPEEVACGMRVQAELVDLPGGDYRVPVFRPAASG
jgi:uncharacterized OB-fold protein